MSVDSLKLRSDLHIARKLWHSIALLAVIVAFHNLDRQSALFYLTIGSGLFVAVDLLRLQIQALNDFVFKVFGPFMRKHEFSSIAGTTYMAISILIIVFFFPKHVVKLTLFFIALADPIASYFGLKYGKDRLIGKKTLQGTLAAFVICTFISLLFYLSRNMMGGHVLVASLISGFIGALGELIPFGKLDDNFTFPIFSSIGLYGLFSLYGAL